MMNFTLTQEQQLLQDSVHRFLAEQYSVSKRQSYLAEDDGYASQLWKKYAELGLTALMAPHTCGGLQGDATDLYVVQREMGKSLALEPFLASAVLSTIALSAESDNAIAAGWLERMVAGVAVSSLAHTESTCRGNTEVNTLLLSSADGYHVQGHKQIVLHGSSADVLIASAVDEAGYLIWCLVPTDAPEVVRRPFRLIDGSAAAEITLQNAPAQLLSTQDKASALLEQINAFGIVASCAEQLGAMEAALAMSLDYVQTRHQFGRPIGANQSLRHLIAEMATTVESATSMTMLAAMAAQNPSTCEPQDLSAAKYLVGRNARSVCEKAIQLHGGVGMAEECGVGHYLLRVLVLDQLFGDSDHHLESMVAAA